MQSTSSFPNQGGALMFIGLDRVYDPRHYDYDPSILLNLTIYFVRSFLTICIANINFRLVPIVAQYPFICTALLLLLDTYEMIYIVSFLTDKI